MLNQRIAITVIVLLAFAALIGGVFVATHAPDKQAALSAQFKGTLLDKPRLIKPFNLMGIDDKAFNEKSLQGHWTMIFFGFTRCGSVCPVTMAKLAKMLHVLDKQHVAPLPQVVMISIDTDRDTLSELAHYVKAFEPRFYGARGSNESIDQLTRELGIVYTKDTSAAPSENNNIQHSGAIILFNPQGQIVAFFTPPIHAAALAADFKLLVE